MQNEINNAINDRAKMVEALKGMSDIQVRSFFHMFLGWSENKESGKDLVACFKACKDYIGN